MWSIRNVVPKEIPFPKYDSFLKGDEKSLDCHWVLGEGEKFLVALFSTDCKSSCNEIKFGLVFNNLMLQNYVYRITFPTKHHIVKIQLTEVDIGNGHFKNVSVAECIRQITHIYLTTRFYYHIYDLRTGKLVETLSNDGWESVITGSYLFPKTRYNLAISSRGGVNISRINWNGSSWSISTHFIKFPNVGNKYCTVSISNVTDTRVTWNTFDSSNHFSRSSIVVCDYLLY